MQSDNAKFYASKMIKVTSGSDFKKTIFSTRRRHHPKTAEIFFKYKWSKNGNKCGQVGAITIDNDRYISCID